MMTRTQIDYASVATRLSALLGRKWGVNVILGGDPQTNGNVITLPHWDFQDPALLPAFYGLIAHEAGGHVRQTDFPMLRSEVKKRLKKANFHIWKSIENILEDIRIEANIQRTYPGAVTYLNAAVDYMLCREASDPAECANYWHLALNWCLLVFRCECLGQSLLAAQATRYEAVFAQVVSVDTITEARRIAKAVAGLGSSKNLYFAVIEYADELYRVLEAALPSRQSGQNGDDTVQGDQLDQSGSDDPQGTQGSENGSGDATLPAVPELDETPLAQAIGDIFAELAEAGKSENPVVLKMPAVGSIGQMPGYNAGIEIVRSELTQAVSMRQALTAALAPMLCGDMEYSANLTSGSRINSRRIARVAAEDEPAIFRKMLIEDDQSVAVQILLDRSRSTEGHCLSKIRISALGLATALEQFQEVETAISAFPCCVKGDAKLYGSQPIKQFGEPVLRSLKHWPEAQGGTPLADAYQSVAFSFLLTQKQRRILIVLTDGRPNSVSEAHDAKRFLRTLGIEVYGVIVSDRSYPKEMFDDSEQIEHAHDLPLRLSALVQRIM